MIGTMKTDGKLAAGVTISQSPDDLAPWVADEPMVFDHIYKETDAAGRFELNRVAPGRHSLGLWVPNGAPRRQWFLNMATFDAQIGQTINLNIGDAGLRDRPAEASRVRRADDSPGLDRAERQEVRSRLAACRSSTTAASSFRILRPVNTSFVSASTSRLRKRRAAGAG